jgi:hypothetical protein
VGYCGLAVSISGNPTTKKKCRLVSDRARGNHLSQLCEMSRGNESNNKEKKKKGGIKWEMTMYSNRRETR